MKNDGTPIGLWVVLIDEGNAPDVSRFLARTHEELYVLAFSTVTNATACLAALGADGGKPFYVLGVNVERVVRELRDAGARGFIVDYDPSRALFASAHALPAAGSAMQELR